MEVAPRAPSRGTESTGPYESLQFPDFSGFLPIFRTFLGDFTPDELDSRSLQALWEWKNRVLLEEYFISNEAIPPEDESEKKTVVMLKSSHGRKSSQVKSSHYKFVHPNSRPSFRNKMTLGTPGVGIIEPQDWEPLGGYTREYQGHSPTSLS